MSRKAVTFQFASDENCFQQFYRKLSEIVNSLSLTEAEKFRLALCVSEAFTNAYLHGNKQDPSKRIRVRILSDQQSIRFDVEDEGEGKVEEVDFQRATPSVEFEKTSGRGLGIIKQYADNIKVEKRKQGGLRVSIFWNLDKQHE